MKKTFTFILTLFLLFSIIGMKAENGKGKTSSVPYKSPNSILYGMDLLINNDPTEDQRNVHISVAFNGWLFAVYTHNISGGNAGITILRSTNNGIDWSILDDYFYAGAYTACDIVVAGNNLTDLKLFVAGIYEAAGNDWRVFCDSFDPQTGSIISQFLFEQSTHKMYDVAIASDYRYPASGISPYSLGIIYSKYGIPYDSTILLTSSDGGNTIGTRNTVAVTNTLFRKVAISYGISQTKFDGRYFVAWEEFESSAPMGHIWTAYTDPWITSPVAAKIKLDSLNSAYLNMCSNPTIATLFNNTVDNSNGNITEMVLFDGNWNPGDNDVIGAYNVKAVGTGIINWNNLIIANTTGDEMQSDINYDPAFNNFLVTYFDSSTQELPYLVHGMNMNLPETWGIISPGYNDDKSNLSNPYPKVEINPVVTKVANVWSSEGAGVGIAMFDAEYSNYVGISQIHQSDEVSLQGAFPNPASTKTSIVFTLTKPSNVTITLYSIFGQELNVITNKTYNTGSNTVDLDVITLPQGTYIYSFKADNFTASGRISVIR
jgi:hypothetical protein